MKGRGRHTHLARTTLMLSLLALALVASGCGLITGGRDESADVSQRNPLAAPVAGESKTATQDSLSYGGEEARVAPLAAPGAAPSVPDSERLVVRTKTLRLRVDDVEKSIVSIRDIAKSHKGSIESMQTGSADEPVYRYSAEGMSVPEYDGQPLLGYVTLRVPVERFDAFVTEVSKVGRILRQVENASDVTQEHIDVTARLKTLRAQETRLREFFSAAKKVTEMLEVERELQRIRSEIEALDAQAKYLERQAAYSTVTVELQGPKPVVRPEGEGWGFVDSLTNAVRAFVGTVNGMIVLAGAFLPIALVLGLVWLVARAVLRRSKQRKARELAETDD